MFILLGKLGWLHFVTLQVPIYERLVWVFMCSLMVDLKMTFRDNIGYIRFRLFNQTLN